MKHKTIIRFSVIAVMLFSMQSVAMAQQTSLMFAKSTGTNNDTLLLQYIQELNGFDISVKVPEGFHSIDMRGCRYINENISPDWPVSGLPINELPAVGLESDNNEAVFLFPLCIFPNQGSNNGFIPMAQMVKAGDLIERELRYSSKDQNLDIRSLIEIISDEDMSSYANADTAVVYELTFRRPFLDQYSSCIGIYLRKYAHPPLLLKIALNKDGLRTKDKYIRLLLDHITYGNNPNAELVKCENSATKDLDFPSEHIEKTGIVNDNL